MMVAALAVVAYLPAAAALALGASSLLLWARLLVDSTWVGWAWIDLAFWVAATVVAWALWRRHRRSWAVRAASHLPKVVAVVLLVVVGAAAVLSFVSATAVWPHGTWDAWAIWNLRARFLFRGIPVSWRDAFAPGLEWSHPDYPLLLPLIVVRGWTWAGSETVAVPVAIAGLFATATVTTAAVSVARARGIAHGVFAACAILASPSFLSQAPAQIADIPLSFYMLTAFVMLFNAAAHPAQRMWWMLAGLSAGLAAWTKNEGVLFLVVFVIASTWCAVRLEGARGMRNVAILLCGAAPSLAALAALKWTIAAPDPLVARQSAGHIAAHLADPRRIRIAATALAKQVWLGGASRVGVLPVLAAYLIASGVRRPVGVPLLAAGSMLAMLAGYLFVYIVTPYDFGWHIATSVERVVLQLFPTFVWSIFMAADSVTLPAFRVPADIDRNRQIAAAPDTRL